MNDTLHISLEAHLVDVLRPLPPIVPVELAESLTPYLVSVRPTTIPYSVLHTVSKWSRTTHGLEKLCTHSPPLEPSQYSMISLLAGTTTSPERKFGTYTPAKEPREMEAERRREKKAITTLLNAMFSIGGSGFATWWAADKTGWKNEWKVLLSLFVAVVVAVSETVLYIIWQSRRSSSKLRSIRPELSSSKHKKDDGDTYSLEPISTQVLSHNDPGLRRR
ncbi:hypothetical protein BDZ94DRAFT_1165080 [Collybia nuda]|uniref:Uncharacterized protein n=1 Tax=Collybia nuda TaxID=64659 RepID=A0A9P5Y431_9AGAR|nr:hypothetical protein BDZ94DRAFT_1165080 [Collybia nuda]